MYFKRWICENFGKAQDWEKKFKHVLLEPFKVDETTTETADEAFIRNFYLSALDLGDKFERLLSSKDYTELVGKITIHCQEKFNDKKLSKKRIAQEIEKEMSILPVLSETSFIKKDKPEDSTIIKAIECYYHQTSMLANTETIDLGLYNKNFDKFPKPKSSSEFKQQLKEFIKSVDMLKVPGAFAKLSPEQFTLGTEQGIEILAEYFYDVENECEERVSSDNLTEEEQ